MGEELARISHPAPRDALSRGRRQHQLEAVVFRFIYECPLGLGPTFKRIINNCACGSDTAALLGVHECIDYIMLRIAISLSIRFNVQA